MAAEKAARFKAEEAARRKAEEEATRLAEEELAKAKAPKPAPVAPSQLTAAVPHQKPKPAWRRPSAGGEPLSERSRVPAFGGSSNGAASSGGAPPSDEAQRTALLEHMRKNGLKVADVLRLCASILDDSERI